MLKKQKSKKPYHQRKRAEAGVGSRAELIKKKIRQTKAGSKLALSVFDDIFRRVSIKYTVS